MNSRPALDAARALAGRPLRFILAGGVNTVFGFTFYPALLWFFPYLHVHYLMALGISQIVCTCLAYFIYKFTVFQTRGGLVHEFVRFCSYYLGAYAFNWAALPLLVGVGHIDPIFAQVGLAIALAVGSYFWHQRVTFKHGSR